MFLSSDISGNAVDLKVETLLVGWMWCSFYSDSDCFEELSKNLLCDWCV